MIDDLTNNQGDIAAIIEIDTDDASRSHIVAIMDLVTDTPSSQDICYSYLTACDSSSLSDIHVSSLRYLSKTPTDTFSLHIPSVPLVSSNAISVPTGSDCISVPRVPSLPTCSDCNTLLLVPVDHFDTDLLQTSTFVTRKYKPVAKRTHPVMAELPEKYRIIRNIVGDPLADMPQLNPNPPPFTPTGRYTMENKAIIDKAHPGDFLWPAERELMHHFMCLQNLGFAWNDSQRGNFRTDFFPPVRMPVVEHKPWVLRNIPIPPGIYNELCDLIRIKLQAGVYEPSNSAYRSRWFTVMKKGGKSFRIVHSLEPLNAVTIAQSGVTPYTEHIADHFAGRACAGVLDLYVGYDERELDEASRDYTTFQTPFGAMRLTSLPMGWTNSVPIFHEDVTYILQPEIPHTTIPYIDDVPIRGPETRYQLSDGTYETISENPGIRRFIWEFFQGINRVVQRMKYSGGTFTGYKGTICASEIEVVGHRCTYEGRLPDEARTEKIVNWGPLKNLSDVRAFLGTIGVARVFIPRFAHRANPLTMLTRKDYPFVYGPEQIEAQEDLTRALLDSPAIRPINYESSNPVIVAVDTSHIAVGYFLCQCDPDDPRKRRYARFGSITLNDRESRFSQPKLELYGLYRALGQLKRYIIGVRNLIVEVDARYIKGMLTNPDLDPRSSLNRWITAILMFQFELVHIPGTHHGSDGLSRRTPQPNDKPPPPDDLDDWIDKVSGFMHCINNELHPSPTILNATYLLTNAIEEVDEEVVDAYDGDWPRSKKAVKEDEKIDMVKKWFASPTRPPDFSDDHYANFMRYARNFFLRDGKLWRRDQQSYHKIVPNRRSRKDIVEGAHDDLGHKSFYSTYALIQVRFWWPRMRADIQWFTVTCHRCQERQLQNILIPPTVAAPASLFAKVSVDSMHMPPSGGFKYIVQGRCSLVGWPEFRMLRKETGLTLGDWIFEDLICRWGLLVELVSDNGPPFVKALEYLAKKYHIYHIRISGYNSRANGQVERSHFDVRQALYKASEGDQSKWSQSAYSVFWADRVSIRRRMGCSPYFAVTGTQPLLPLDISEATFLVPPPDSVWTTTDLMVSRAIALQKRSADLVRLRSKVMAHRVAAAVRFERTHAATIRDFDFKRGDLVLVRNTAIEKALNRKMRARYFGPVVVLSRNRGGAYILCELDGNVFDRPTAAFRVVPYFARRAIPLPDLDNFLNVPTARLRELEDSTIADPEDEEVHSRIEELPDDEDPASASDGEGSDSD